MVSQPLLPDEIIIEKKAESVESGIGMPAVGEIRTINGKDYLVHKVLEHDSV